MVLIVVWQASAFYGSERFISTYPKFPNKSTLLFPGPSADPPIKARCFKAHEMANDSELRTSLVLFM